MSISLGAIPQINYYRPQNLNGASVQAASQNDASQRTASAVAKSETTAQSGEIKDKSDPNYVCKTCKQRRYQDQSNDPSVSFKSPGYISPGSSAAVVASHEQEHVTHEQAQAGKEGRRIVSQTVALHYAVCPECHKTYVSGGETRTVTASDHKESGQNKLDIRV